MRNAIAGLRYESTIAFTGSLVLFPAGRSHRSHRGHLLPDASALVSQPRRRGRRTAPFAAAKAQPHKMALGVVNVSANVHCQRN